MKRAQQGPVLDLIESIRQRTLSGRSLRKVDRQRCVECLSAEGASLPEISKLLGFHERTIQRDREEIRKRNALRVGDSFAAEVAGELVGDYRAGIDRLRRLTHDKQATPADRIEAEKAVLVARSRMVELLQSMGYLPITPRTVVAGITALRGEPPNLYEEAKRLTSIVEQVAHVLPAPENSDPRDSSAAESG